MPFIMSKVNIPKDDQDTAWMTLSEFVNNFVKKYEPDIKIKVIDFLTDLQKIILSESEIQSL